MKKVWKFSLGIIPANTIPIIMPKGAKLLTVNVQQRNFMLWAEVDTLSPNITRLFAIFATGEPFPSDDLTKKMEFLGTVFHDALVWHVYDLGEST